jgi:phage tail tape-measure protein
MRGDPNMIRWRCVALAAVLACVLLGAGCGGGSTSGTATTTGARTTPSPTGSSSTSSTPTSTTPSSANVAKAIAACKAAIRAHSTLPASARAKLEAICGKVARGDKNAVRAVAREVCEEVVKDSSLPAGPSREQALAACRAK